ncbi:hypothetical protein LB505_003143 [Fusarium chuoi]|nr:hypothetical protein LB505_003143 [Fusarium chuoi]
MHISDDFQTLCERVQTMVRQRRRKEKRHMEITLYASRTSRRQSNWHRRSSQPYRPSLALFNLEPLLPSSPTTHQDCPNIHFSLVHRQPPLIEYGH